MIIGCTGNYRKKEFYSILENIHNKFKIPNYKLLLSSDYLNKPIGKIPKSFEITDFDDVIVNSNIVFAIGGDGTILSTLRRMESNIKPILGIHIGGLGFLSECSEENLTNKLNDIIDDKYKIITRTMLEAVVALPRKNKKIFRALNDFVVNQNSYSRIIKVKVNVSGEYLNTYESDGIIISTPTGSTAYSLSAGGPIIEPSVNTLTVTPICSHSLSARPIILDNNNILSLEFNKYDQDIALSVDGQIRISIDNNNKLEIRKAKDLAQFISFKENGYFSTLRSKMGWAGNVR